MNSEDPDSAWSPVQQAVPPGSLRWYLRYGFFLLMERALTWCVNPRWRAGLLRLMGATVGRDVRVQEARFFNLYEKGFRLLTLGDNVFVGQGCWIDLTAPVTMEAGVAVSQGAIILTHQEHAMYDRSPVKGALDSRIAPVRICANAYVGAGAVVLCGVEIGSRAIVGAGSVVTKAVPADTVVVGSPARPLREVPVDEAVA